MNDTRGNRVALVTGGSRGIGAAITKRLARDGASVAFTYVGSRDAADDVVRAIVADGGSAMALEADSGDPTALRRAVADTVARFARLDVLVNNAGIARVGPLQDQSLADVDAMLAVNLRGPIIAIQEALRHLGRGGRIVNVGSSNSDFFPFPGASLYTATKSALLGLTRGLARELGPRGITVNAVLPGPTDTEMNPKTSPFAADITKHIAVGRYASTQEIAGAVAYLASPEAAFVTGASLKIDGGLSS